MATHFYGSAFFGGEFFSVGGPGYAGLLDFVGYPVSTTPGPGFVGLLDFAGYPVGQTSGIPPAEPLRLLACCGAGI